MVHIDYGKIISKSWDITKRNKWLWVYGLVLAILGGSSARGSGSGGSGSSASSPSPQLKNLPGNIPQETEKVLGTATDTVSQWLSNVPVSTWIIIGIIILTVIIIGIIISWIARSWAKAGLIAGVADASDGREVSLVSTSPRGIASCKNIMIYDLLIGIISIGVLIVFLVLGVIGFIAIKLIPIVGIIISVIAGLILVFTFIFLIILCSIISVYAERLIVLRKYAPWDAFNKGLVIAKKNAVPTVLMGLINDAFGCGAGCISSAITIILILPAVMLGIICAGVFGSDKPENITSLIVLLPVLAGVGMVIISLIISVNCFISALVNVWKYSNWNEFFREIIKTEEDFS
jgi:hypothetical protein